ncbi:hypothetical protein NIES4071_101400 (plasmid) [Calothrix sp. NIES-4071]|nr:hypothetical protein NIES4071_101400 [Calothrix sp. NIES-4071]BAZ64521.1 hypothetical protein NIES4105_102540 [Calothrix sp. NIES-4105]
MKNTQNTSMFTEITSEEAANVNGGYSLGGYDFQGSYYAPGIAGLFDPNTYYGHLNYFSNLFAYSGFAAFDQGGSLGLLNHQLGIAGSLSNF